LPFRVESQADETGRIETATAPWVLGVALACSVSSSRAPCSGRSDSSGVYIGGCRPVAPTPSRRNRRAAPSMMRC